jgi:DNA-binding ferritin-like protein
MAKTRRNKSNGSTRKNIHNDKSSASILLKKFQREIVMVFLEVLLMVKLYHWKTYSYATHKATDELYGKLNEHIDRFVEILLGKTEKRTDFMNVKSIKLIDLNSTEQLKIKVDSFKGYLVNLNNNKAMKLMGNMDLLTVRDEILGDLNQFLYLLTFK